MSNPPSLSTLLTPSEVVLFHASRLVHGASGETIPLLNDTAEASCRELLTLHLKAALLALESAGAIQFEIDQAEKRLYVERAGPSPAWPYPSTESRLEFRGRELLSTVIDRWHGQRPGWKRAAEKAFIPLVLRKLAVVSQKAQRRTYIVVDRNAQSAADEALPAIIQLLDACREARPELWKLLATEIEKGIAAAGGYEATFEIYDPWYDESDADQRNVPGLKIAAVQMNSWRNAAFGALVFWGMLVAFFVGFKSSPEAILITMLLAIGISTVNVLWGLRISRRFGLAERRLRAAANMQSAGNVIQNLLLGTAVIALVMITIYHLLDNWLVRICTAAAMLGGAAWALRKKAGQAIVAQVTGTKEQVRPSEPAPPPPPPVAAAPLPFELDILDPSALPGVSPACQTRLGAIRERGPGVKRLYKIHTIELGIASLALSILGWWLLETPPDSINFPFASLCIIGFCVGLAFEPKISRENAGLEFTFLVVRSILRYLRGGAAAERQLWEGNIKPIRPIFIPLLGLVIAIWTAGQAIYFASHYTLPVRWLFAAVSLAIVLIYFRRIAAERRRLEAAFPLYPRLNLLALRVFESPSRDRFLALLDLWHWFGPIYRLDGPDTVGGKAGDVLAYLTGHLDRAIVEDEAELEQARGAFHVVPDSQLRHAINSMQCNNATWKKAIQHMFDIADVVVMDLSGLSEKNRGSAYEIGKLVNEVPFDKYLLLVDGDTDLPLLRRILAESAASPNGINRGTNRKLRLLQMDTVPQRKTDESIYDWQRRIESAPQSPIDADRLTALLFDAASIGKPAPAPLIVPWAGPGYLPARPYGSGNRN